MIDFLAKEQQVERLKKKLETLQAKRKRIQKETTKLSKKASEWNTKYYRSYNKLRNTNDSLDYTQRKIVALEKLLSLAERTTVQGRVGIQDTRQYPSKEAPRVDGTFWEASWQERQLYKNTWAAKFNGKSKGFATAAEAKQYAKCGTTKTRVARGQVDVVALNKVLNDTGFKVVPK